MTPFARCDRVMLDRCSFKGLGDENDIVTLSGGVPLRVGIRMWG
jgi:hypothetical protein